MCASGAAQRSKCPPRRLKTGSLFGGWFKDEECTQPWDFDEDTVDKNMTLYARWN